MNHFKDKKIPNVVIIVSRFYIDFNTTLRCNLKICQQFKKSQEL